MESNLSGKYLMAEDDDENANTERATSDEIFLISFQKKTNKQKKKQGMWIERVNRWWGEDNISTFWPT